jgi:hypothetical protein
MSLFIDSLNRVVNEGQPVTLVFNEVRREVPFSLARNKTVAQLYAENAAMMGLDPKRVSNFVLNNEVIPTDYVLRPGEVVRATVNSENKG